jgi:nucleoside-diphosphate-sugar epimerase
VSIFPDRPHALIGHTGFVGSNLLRQHNFDALYNSSNIESLADTDVGLLVCAGAPAAKWQANAAPDADKRNLERLMSVLRGTRAQFAVLISTVDVFPNPVGVDERSSPDVDGLHAYGRHRLMLEQFVASQFDTLIVRLPGLFGHGLKKNVIHDLLRSHELHRIDARASYQFYGLDRLWRDIGIAMDHTLRLVHFATEPVTVRELAAASFSMEFSNELAGPPAGYDMWTRHAGVFGQHGNYLEDRQQVLHSNTRFVSAQRAVPTPLAP